MDREGEPEKKEDTRLKDLHQEIVISLAEQKRNPIRIHSPRDQQRKSIKREGARSSISGPSLFKQGSSIQVNLDLATKASPKADNVTESLGNINKATPKAEDTSNNPNLISQAKRASLKQDHASGTLQNLDKDLQTNKEESPKKLDHWEEPNL